MKSKKLSEQKSLGGVDGLDDCLQAVDDAWPWPADKAGVDDRDLFALNGAKGFPFRIRCQEIGGGMHDITCGNDDIRLPAKDFLPAQEWIGRRRMVSDIFAIRERDQLIEKCPRSDGHDGVQGQQDQDRLPRLGR